MNDEYLVETKTIDYRAPIIREKVLELRNGVKSTIDYMTIDYIVKAYEFVRDEVFYLVNWMRLQVSLNSMLVKIFF